MFRIAYPIIASVAVLFPASACADIIGVLGNMREDADLYYRVEAIEQDVAIEVSSTDFDTTLVLAGPNGAAAYNDDDWSSTDSRIVVQGGGEGTWYVTVSSFLHSGTGSFLLVVTGASNLQEITVSDVPELMLTAMRSAGTGSMSPSVGGYTVDPVFSRYGGVFADYADDYMREAGSSYNPSDFTHAEMGQPSQGNASPNGSGLNTQVAEAEPLPNLWPWPPPTPSGKHVLQRELFDTGESPTFGNVNDQLRAALASVGHEEVGYYHVPGGFAMVTRLERMEEGGATVTSDRWVREAPRPEVGWSLSNYIRALITTTSGHFRVLAFITAAESFHPSETAVDTDTLHQWAMFGENVLPDPVRNLPFEDGVEITALVYEVSKIRGARRVIVHVPGQLTGADHLRHLGVIAALGGSE